MKLEMMLEMLRYQEQSFTSVFPRPGVQKFRVLRSRQAYVR